LKCFISFSLQTYTIGGNIRQIVDDKAEASQKVIVPKGYPATSVPENQSIAALTFVFSKHTCVNAKIEKNDKTPDLDGEVEILDERLAPTGRVAIQVKTFPVANRENPKFGGCPLSLFAVAANHTLPVIIIALIAKSVKRIGNISLEPI
jgi:hypothetical protein